VWSLDASFVRELAFLRTLGRTLEPRGCSRGTHASVLLRLTAPNPSLEHVAVLDGALEPGVSCALARHRRKPPGPRLQRTLAERSHAS
jgi:hypothetical protein